MKAIYLLYNICLLELVYCDYDIYDSQDDVDLEGGNNDLARDASIENAMQGGNETDIKNYPFIVSLQKSLIPKCVGSLVSLTWVLTVAHCLIDMDKRSTVLLSPEDFVVISGRTILTEDVKGGQERQASMFVIHSRFEKLHINYDVGLVRTASPFIFNSLTQPAKLYEISPEVKTVLQCCTLIGWVTNRQSFDSYEPVELEANKQKLQEMELRMMDFHQCQAVIGRMISSDSLCAHLDGNCPGKCGSPLICGGTLFGVLTWTAGCRFSKMPAVFLRISKINIWINNVTQGVFTEAFRKETPSDATVASRKLLRFILVYNFWRINKWIYN